MDDETNQTAQMSQPWGQALFYASCLAFIGPAAVAIYLSHIGAWNENALTSIFFLIMFPIVFGGSYIFKRLENWILESNLFEHQVVLRKTILRLTDIIPFLFVLSLMPNGDPLTVFGIIKEFFYLLIVTAILLAIAIFIWERWKNRERAGR